MKVWAESNRTVSRCSVLRWTAAAGLFSSWAIPAVNVPNWAIFSLCRNRFCVFCQRDRMMSNIDAAADGLICNRLRRSSRPMPIMLVSVRARTVAVRGESNTSAISPNTSPGPRVASRISRFWLTLMISTSPLSMM